jgi:hypothetical protein
MEALYGPALHPVSPLNQKPDRHPSSLTQDSSSSVPHLLRDKHNSVALETLEQDRPSLDSDEGNSCFTPESSGTYSYLNDVLEDSLSDGDEFSEIPPLAELETGDLDPTQDSKERQSPQEFWTWEIHRQRWIHEEPDGTIIECPEELD